MAINVDFELSDDLAALQDEFVKFEEGEGSNISPGSCVTASCGYLCRYLCAIASQSQKTVSSTFRLWGGTTM